MTTHGAEVGAVIDADADADADAALLGEPSRWSAPVLSVSSVPQAASATSSTEHPTNLASAPDEEAEVTAED
jgi:hypothetical protein